MRGKMTGLVVLGLIVGLVGIAQAQRQRGPGFGGPGMLLRNTGVQKELKLSEDQVGKLKDALAKVFNDHKGEFKDASKEDREKLMKTMGEETQKALAGILKPEQMKRLKQIQWQQGGARAFANPEVQKALKLSAEQKEKIKTINEDSGKKMRELFQGGFNEETQKKIAELRKETAEKATGVLTADQKKDWKEMTGKPFEVKFERPRGKKDK